MKQFRHTLSLFASLLAVVTACGKETSMPTPPVDETPEATSQEAKVLVACFSFTGSTKTVASSLATLAGGTLYLIESETPYGNENSNYYDENTRAYKEQYGPASVRPSIKKNLENAGDYDIILIGFPIWYGKAPRDQRMQNGRTHMAGIIIDRLYMKNLFHIAKVQKKGQIP